jgi:hypothetical protein
MRKFKTIANAAAFGLMAAGLVTLTAATASADDGHYSYRYNGHARFHDELDHRAFHRELDHREAHRYPMTWRQHERLHDSLDHEAFHDRLEHRAYHRPQYIFRSYNGFPGNSTYRSYGYRPYGTTFGYYGPRGGVSLYFGH